MTKAMIIAVLASALAVGCAGSEGEAKSGDSFTPGNNTTGNGGGENTNSGNSGGGNNVIEEEVEFGFSRPAVVGGRIFVANADLNTVAAIDADTARITTIPVGFAPTKVVGPEDSGVDGSVFVLNEGASTVTVISPNLSTETFGVGRATNNMVGAPDGRAAATWFGRADAGASGGSGGIGDLSSIDLVTPEGSFQISVGFNVIDAVFTEDSQKLLVTSADGVSVIEVDEVEEDSFAAPIAVLPSDLQAFDPVQRELILSPDGAWAVARLSSFEGLVLTELETEEQWVLNLADVPTDIDWVPGDTPRITANLRQRSELLVATIPDGFAGASVLPYPSEMDEEPMNGADAGMDAGADAGMDAGADAGMDAGMTADAGMDAGMTADAGMDAGMTADTGMDAGTEPGEQVEWPETEGFEYLDLEFPRLGLTEVARNGTTALIYTSIGNDGRAILVDLDTLEQRLVPFEKGIVRVESDADGEVFVIIHNRVEGSSGAANPGDDDFIQSRHGLSVLDVPSGASRLALTEEEPQQAVLWDEGDERLLYVAFAPIQPQPSDFDNVAKRALATINLRSFALSRTTLPSLPNGLGTIPTAGKVYISQIHPQGRITFIDVSEGTLRTVTGFQLNAGID